jgi:signal transduction histidine kinase
MSLVNYLLAFSITLIFLLSILIVVSNPMRQVNRALAGFFFAMCVWLLSNLLTNLAPNVRLSILLARTTLIGAVFIPYAFLVFCAIFTHRETFKFKKACYFFIPILIVLLTVPTKLNIVSIAAYGQKTVTGDVYFLLVPIVIVYFFWGLVWLIQYYRQTKKSVEKAQLFYIFIGIIFSLVPVVIANGILPAFGDGKAILYGPDAVIVLAVFMTVAIVRYRLLDIRLIVARSIAYLLLLATTVGLYGILTFGIALKVFGADAFSERVVPIVMAVFLAFTVQPLREYFARLTNRFFYRDAYDSQVFLDNFNKILVSTYDLDLLLSQASLLINENIKPLYCAFVLKRTIETKRKVIGSGNVPGFSHEQLDAVKHSLDSFRENVVVVDLIADEQGKTKDTLLKNEIAAGACISATFTSADNGVGYILLGRKKSGNLYTSQDIKILKIITNELVIAIQNALRFEEIENFNQTLQMKVDGATKELRRANERLKALDETKDDFISMASHQLRTPLTSVKGYLSMVIEGDVGTITKTQRQMLNQAFVSSQRMVYLIADLLNVSRLKTGKFLIDDHPIDLIRITEEEVAQLIETAKSRNLELRFNHPKTVPNISLDETKIRQVIMNFIDNAIYYTPSGGHITVDLEERPSTLALWVTDDGIGVPRSERPHLFTKFYRAGNARKARPDGTGLGLFMAKKVIVAEGGSIIFDTHEGKGSTFGFMFSKIDNKKTPDKSPLLK